MSSIQPDEKQETESVSVFVRPLEVTVAADFTSSSEAQSQSSSNVKPNVPPPPPPKATNTVWSTMTSVIESETSVKRWSTPLIKKEEGTPPGPEDHPQTKEGQAREGNVIGITPNYKIGEGKPKSELNLGKTGYLPNEKGDYKVSMRHEDYKQTIIDPKVQSNAKMPYSSSTLPEAKRQLADDFPSSHSKRSLIKLEPLEQRRFKSVESRPITTSNYLTESVERHRDMEASRLREYLKARESDANKPWNKPGWPGPKSKNDDESMRELEHIRKSIETLQKAAQQPPKDVSTATWQFSTQSFSPRSVVSVNGAREDILKDDKPRSIMKRRELESREQMMYPSNQNQLVEHNKYQRSHSNVVSKPTITETVQRIEEHRRTEEIERRVQRKERRDRRSRHHSSSRHHSGAEAWDHGGYYTERRVASLPRLHPVYQYSDRAMTQDEMDKVVREAYEAADEARRQNYRGRSSSLSRGHSGYLPSSHEQYSRHVSTRRCRACDT